MIGLENGKSFCIALLSTKSSIKVKIVAVLWLKVLNCQMSNWGDMAWSAGGIDTSSDAPPVVTVNSIVNNIFVSLNVYYFITQ